MAKKQTPKKPDIVINQLTVAQLNRTREDIGTWQSAIKSAENVNMPKRKKLYEVYNNILTDGFLTSLMEKRIRAVKTSPINIEGVEDEELINRFKTPWFFKLLEYIMQSKFWGHSLVEFTLDPVDNDISKTLLIPRHHVVPERGIIQLTVGSDANAIPYNEDPFDKYLLGIGEKNDLGMLLRLAPYALYKRGNIADYADFNEMFGQPIRQYTYDPHDPNSRMEAENAAKNSGQAAWIVVPRGTDLELHQASGISASGTFKDFNKVMNDEMAITVLGQTLTTTNDGVGSNALGRVHKDVEESINLEDKLFCEYVLNHDFKWMMVQHGMPLENAMFKFDDTQRMTVEQKYKMFIELNKQFPIDPLHVYEELNIPVPDESVIKEWKANRKAKQPGGAAPVPGK